MSIVSTGDVCPLCGAAVTRADSFCTTCGTALGRSSEESVDTAVIPVPLATPLPLRRRRRWLSFVAVGLIAFVLAAASAFALLWRSQSQHATRLQHRLNQASSDLSHTRSALARTTAALQSTSALSARRRAVLVKAQLVLKKVDPLLSDADGIKQITVQIQTARDQFAADSSQMTENLLVLENYEANPQNYPTVDQTALVGEVNSELETVRSDYANLTSTDGAFSDASTKFGNHADAFTSAVRSLQTKLKGVTQP